MFCYICINAPFHFPSRPQDIVVTPQSLKKIPSGACLLFVPSSTTTAATLHPPTTASSTASTATTSTASTTNRKTKVNGSEEEEVEDYDDDEEVRIGFQSFSKEDIQISGNPVGR